MKKRTNFSEIMKRLCPENNYRVCPKSSCDCELSETKPTLSETCIIPSNAVIYEEDTPNQSEMEEIEETNTDTPKCEKCKGRTALVTGNFSYHVDDEPYKSGISEQAISEDGDCWLGAHKCDECGNIQGFWIEG